MKTVGDFKKAGLVFVRGDAFKDADGHTYKRVWYKHSNADDERFDSCDMAEFAWRENTGVKPEFSGAIDAIIGTSDDVELIECAPIGDFQWELDHSCPTIKWRPSLNQPEQNTSNIEAAKPNDKPVLSEIDDLKHELKLHKANSELLASLTEFMVNNNIGAAGESCIDVAIRELSEKHSIDTRTPKQKAVDEMFEDAKVRGSKVAFERIYDAGHRKLTPSQAKAYDDKTEYFGEDYKR